MTLGKIYLKVKLLINHIYISFRCKSVGAKATIRKPILCTYDKVAIGDRSHVKEFSRIEAISSWSEQTFEPMLIIGNGVSIQQNAHITFAGHMEIHDGCLIAPRVTITDIHHINSDHVTYPSFSNIVVKPTIIEKGVFIGTNVVILPGTRIGEFSTIGANQVISGKIPARTVIKDKS